MTPAHGPVSGDGGDFVDLIGRPQTWRARGVGAKGLPKACCQLLVAGERRVFRITVVVTFSHEKLRETGARLACDLADLLSAARAVLGLAEAFDPTYATYEEFEDLAAACARADRLPGW